MISAIYMYLPALLLLLLLLLADVQLHVSRHAVLLLGALEQSPHGRNEQGVHPGEHGTVDRAHHSRYTVKRSTVARAQPLHTSRGGTYIKRISYTPACMQYSTRAMAGRTVPYTPAPCHHTTIRAPFHPAAQSATREASVTAHLSTSAGVMSSFFILATGTGAPICTRGDHNRYTSEHSRYTADHRTAQHRTHIHTHAHRHTHAHAHTHTHTHRVSQ